MTSLGRLKTMNWLTHSQWERKRDCLMVTWRPLVFHLHCQKETGWQMGMKTDSKIHFHWQKEKD